LALFARIWHTLRRLALFVNIWHTLQAEANQSLEPQLLLQLMLETVNEV